MNSKKAIIFVLVMLISASAISCSINPPELNNQNTAEQIIVTEEPYQISETEQQAVSVYAKGEIITSNRVDNTQGGYFVPIPDSWFNKVSYITEGTHTYFYHITSDKSQPEINPIILHVNMEENLSQDTLCINVFMVLGDFSFYEIPRLDTPYSQGSPDDVEFNSFYEEIPHILQSVWVIDESLWQFQTTPPVIPLGAPFAESDAYIDSFYIGQASVTEVTAAISETPYDIESITWGATGELEETYKYTFGEISFLDGTLYKALITDSTILGPRGFGVGDDISDIIASFTTIIELDNSEITIFYRTNSGSADYSTNIPPAAVLYKSPRANSRTPESMLSLTCFDDDVDLTGLSESELMDMYTYSPVCSCSFYFDTNDVVTEFVIMFVASAE